MNYLEIASNKVIRDIEICLINEAYIAAFNTALTIPDIFATLDKPAAYFCKSRKYYKRWLVDNLFVVSQRYTDMDNPSISYDLYALRCAFLHNASNDIEYQSAQKVIAKFKITYSKNAQYGHLASVSGLHHVNDFGMDENITIKDNQVVHTLKDSVTGEQRQFLFQRKEVAHFSIFKYCLDMIKALKYYVEKNHLNETIQKNASKLFLMDSGSEMIDFNKNVDPDY